MPNLPLVTTRQYPWLLLMMTSIFLSGIRSTVAASSLSSRSHRLLACAFLPKRHRPSTTLPLLTTTRWLSGGDIPHDIDKNLTLLEPVEATKDLPFREFGYRSKPFSWEELHQIIVVDQDLARLSRSVDAERRYKQEREELLEEYESIYDHILHTKFDFDKQRDEESGKWRAVSPATTQPKVSLVKNDYPYFIESDIEHWVLWKLYEGISKDDVDGAIAELQSMYNGDFLDTIWWENPPALKSLPDINHIHILVKRNAKEL